MRVAVARINDMPRELKPKRKVVFADACRNTPFSDSKGQVVVRRAAVKSKAFLEAHKSARGVGDVAAASEVDIAGVWGLLLRRPDAESAWLPMMVAS